MEAATWMPLSVAAVVVAAAVVTVVVVLAGRHRIERDLDASRAELDAVRHKVEELSTQITGSGLDKLDQPVTPVAREFVITSLPDGGVAATLATRGDDQTPRASSLSAGQFASVALGESLVRVLSLGYGVGRALSPENRNRIRFAMRQEVRRARRQRRRDLKETRRHLRAQQAGGEHAHGGDAEAA